MPPPSVTGTEMSSVFNENEDEESRALRRSLKRAKIVNEIVDTEKQFLNDMEILMEVYRVPAMETGALSPHEVKILFANLDVVIQTSREVLDVLLAATQGEDTWVGEAFNQMMRRIETTYCDYCKNNEAAMTLLAALASPDCPPETKKFLQECQSRLQGRTGAWDLGSLVIKPVQRVLKYPLLIKQLLKETVPTHPDHVELVRASVEIEKVAEKINEVKKRKDIVEKYVDGKGNTNVIHGITKKWTRSAQQVKMALPGRGADGTYDELYDALSQKLDLQYRSASQLYKDLDFW
ncbi:Dbl homology domain-containing protein, partial [Blyttiomyces helicus]